MASALAGLQPGLRCTEVIVSTSGDRDGTTPLPSIGGAGVFTDALERALLDGDIDVAVHSLKDMPVDDPDGLITGAIGRRADPRDVLISRDGWTRASLPHGARVGTCSTRRSAQLLAARPDLVLAPLRGNVDTRVGRALAGDFDAIVIAAAGVLRLGLDAAITEYLALEEMLPAPGQGALAVQCRTDDGGTRALVAPLDEPEVRAATEAERGFLAGLGGGCTAPVAAHAVVKVERSGPVLQLQGLVASPDGRRVIRGIVVGAPAGGRILGLELADNLRRQGAGELLS